MKEFKAKYRRSHYKSDATYIRAVYQKNKTVIDEKLRDIGNPYKIFKEQIKEFKEQGKTVTESINTIARSTIFTTEKERLHENFWSGLKAFKEEYKQFKELTKEKGRYTKLDDSKIVWDRNARGYVYDNKILITYENSPFGIKFTKL